MTDKGEATQDPTGPCRKCGGNGCLDCGGEGLLRKQLDIASRRKPKAQDPTGPVSDVLDVGTLNRELGLSIPQGEATPHKPDAVTQPWEAEDFPGEATPEGDVYLPMACPFCKRHRLLWNGHVVTCEKCTRTSADDAFDADAYGTQLVEVEAEGVLTESQDLLATAREENERFAATLRFIRARDHAPSCVRQRGYAYRDCRCDLRAAEGALSFLRNCKAGANDGKPDTTKETADLVGATPEASSSLGAEARAERAEGALELHKTELAASNDAATIYMHRAWEAEAVIKPSARWAEQHFDSPHGCADCDALVAAMFAAPTSGCEAGRRSMRSLTKLGSAPSRYPPWATRRARAIGWFWAHVLRYESEICQRCGHAYRWVWWADGALWAEVAANFPVRMSLVCPRCFTKLARRLGIGVAFYASAHVRRSLLPPGAKQSQR